MNSEKQTPFTDTKTIGEKRKNKMQSIREKMKLMPVMKKNTIEVQKKLQKQKKRRESIQLTNISLDNFSPDEYEDSPDIRNSFQERYELLEKIGQGVHGIVKKCRHKVKNCLMAVKIIKLTDEHIPILKTNFVDIKKLNHPNIIRYKALYFDYKKNVCYLVMQYVKMPNLLQINIKNEQDLKAIAMGVLQALAYLHKNGLCHRDIKPENILYDSQKKKVKLIDFGICKNLHKRGRYEQMLTVTGTLFYRAPEMFHGGGYNELVDMWALGVTIYKLVMGKTPFESIYLSQTITNIQKKQLHFQQFEFEGYSHMLVTFLSRLLRRKREQRLKAEEAKKHFWFETQQLPQDFLTRSDSFKLIQHRQNRFIKLNQISAEGQKLIRKKSCQGKEIDTSTTLPKFQKKKEFARYFDKIDLTEQKEFQSDEQIQIGLD